MSAPRLGRGRAVVLVLILGLALFAASLPTWATGAAPTMVGAQPVAIGGSQAAPGVPSAGAVVLVSALVLGLSGRVTRVLAIIGVILGGALGAVSAAQFLADPAPALLREAGAITGVAQLDGDAAVTAFPTVALVVAVLVALAGIGLPFVLGSWHRVGRRYEVGTATDAPDTAPQERPAAGRLRAMDDWDALSRGDDPSDGHDSP